MYVEIKTIADENLIKMSLTSSNSNLLNNLLSSRTILSSSSDYSSQEHATYVNKMVYQSQDWSHLITEWDPTYHDTSWLLSHVSDMVQYRPSLKIWPGLHRN